MTIPVNSPPVLAGLLSDPVRYAILERLVAGPATVSELVALLGVPQPKASNHLALLREGGIVQTERSGRSVVYALADPAYADLLEALQVASGTGRSIARTAPQIAVARSCYDHVAGKLGVALFRSLVARGALRDVASVPRSRKVRGGLGEVSLGPRAEAIFSELAIDLDDVAAQRRQFATACNDWTESRPHLGGALGAALQTRMLRERWILRRSGTRALRITEPGRDALRTCFGIQTEALHEGFHAAF